jgi:hypothetical protein
MLGERLRPIIADTHGVLMKTLNVFKKPRAIALPLTGEELRERKLIFKRLRPPPPWRQHWRWPLILKSFKLVLNAFRHPELVRHIAPGERPIREHEWKEVNPAITQNKL